MKGVFIGKIVKYKNPDYIWIQLLEKPGLTVSKDTFKNFYFGEFIIFRILKRNQKIEVEKLYTFQKSQIGIVRFMNQKFWIEFSYEEEKILIPYKNSFLFSNGDKIEFHFEMSHNNKIMIVSKKLDPKKCMPIKNIVKSFSLPIKHSKTNLLEDSSDSCKHIRRDLTHEEIFTIDATSTSISDDAISLKKEEDDYILGIHIIDVDHYIPKNSPLDLEAQKRGKSIYLFNQTIPLFPFSISKNILSLDAFINRYAITFEITISKEGNIKKISCFPSIICSKKKMKYESVNRILEGNNVMGYEDFTDTLQNMDLLADLFHQKRIERGALEIKRFDQILKLDSSDYVINLALQKEIGKAQQMIAEFMLFVNSEIAHILSRQNLIYPSRIQTGIDTEKLNEVQKKLSSIGVSIPPLFMEKKENQSIILNQLLKKYDQNDNHKIILDFLLSILKKQKYSVKEMGHFSLALPRITHFTSPIRRYIDLVVARILKEHYFLSKPQTEEEIEEITEYTEKYLETENRIDRCIQKVIEVKGSEYLNNHIGEILDGIIKDCTDKGILIEMKGCIQKWISNEKIGGIYDTSKYCYQLEDIVYQIGMNVKVKLIKDPKQYGNTLCEIVPNSKVYSLKK